ncbi:MAG: GAF domain-containing protein [Anaerolineaceae bacterium]|nr:GAF domain-containing protein [Anaerolineaceae bacterium]
MTDTRSSLELLFNVSRELTSALDLHTVLTRVLSLSTSSVQAERGSVIVMDEHQQPVDAAIIYEERLVSYTVDSLKSTLGQGLAGWVVAHVQPALVPDTSQDTRWLRRPDDEDERSGAKSAICVPITVHEELVGVLTMVHATPNLFNREHLALLQSISDQAGIAIHNARLYESLQAAHRRYQELFEDSIDPILITDLQGKIQETNRQAVTVSGRTRNALLNTTVWDLQSLRPEWLQNNLPEIHAGETVNSESEFFPQNRTPISVEIYLHKVSFGGVDLLQWIVRDITERKQLDTLRDDLSAMIYHDLRSPLANIVSSLDMLRALLPDVSDNTNPVVPQVLSIAIRSSDRMQRLINSLLDINRLEAGQPITNRITIDILPLVREAIDAIQPVTSTKRQNLSIDIEEGLPGIWGDEDMIRRVLINLLENASKFTPIEGSLLVGARKENDWVRIWVEDTGPGIPPEAQGGLFNKFSHIQGERVQSDRLPKGLGLGLAFCKLAILAHGGSIGVESEPGTGSCFFFTVPTAKE